MKYRQLLAFGLVFIACLRGETYCAPMSSLMDSIKMCLVEQRYSVAHQAVRRMLTENPRDIEALYFSSAIQQTEILDYESYSIDAERYCSYADSSLKAISSALPFQKGKDSLDCLFYMASILGGIGVIKAKNGNWTGAFKKALASAKHFKHIVNIDSTYYAAYYGVGVFNYYLSQQLKWLPFFGDKRIEAIQQLRKATRAPFPFDFGACNSLCWIYIERNEFKEADSIASSVLSKYPDNTLFIRIKIRIDLASHKWNNALSLACRLIELSSKREPINWPDIVSGYQAVVCSYHYLNRYDESLEAANTALTLPIPDQFRKIPFVKKHLKYIEGIRKKYAALKPPRRVSAQTLNTQSFLKNQATWHFAGCRDF